MIYSFEPRTNNIDLYSIVFSIIVVAKGVDDIHICTYMIIVVCVYTNSTRWCPIYDDIFLVLSMADYVVYSTCMV